MNTSIGFVKDEENEENPYHKMVPYFNIFVKVTISLLIFNCANIQKKYVAFFAFLGIVSGLAAIITGFVFKRVFTALIDDEEVLSQS